MLTVNVIRHDDGIRLIVIYNGPTENVLVMVIDQKYFNQTINMVKNYYELNLLNSVELWHIVLELVGIIDCLDTFPVDLFLSPIPCNL